VIRKVQVDPKITSSQIAAEVKNEFGKEVHPMTVRRALHEANYHNRTAKRKPLISEVNKKKR